MMDCETMAHITTLFLLVLLPAACSGSHALSQATMPSVSNGVSTTPTNRGLPFNNVVNFGAKGDGATNDTAAINAAMTACTTLAVPDNGCVLYFPAGVYITTGLTLRSYISVKGDGWGT